MARNRQEYQATRIKVLQNHPDLAAEFKAIEDEMSLQRAKMDSAMIEADPKVAPILAKLDAYRQHNLPSGMPPIRSAPGTPNH